MFKFIAIPAAVVAAHPYIAAAGAVALIGLYFVPSLIRYIRSKWGTPDLPESADATVEEVVAEEVVAEEVVAEEVVAPAVKTFVKEASVKMGCSEERASIFTVESVKKQAKNAGYTDEEADRLAKGIMGVEEEEVPKAVRTKGKPPRGKKARKAAARMQKNA